MPHSGHVAAHVAVISACIGHAYGIGVGVSGDRRDQLHPALRARRRERGGDLRVHRARVIGGLGGVLVPSSP